MKTSDSKSLQPIPTFESEDEERDFWATHDAADFVDFNQAKRVSFPNLKPSTSIPATTVRGGLIGAD